MMTVVVCCIFVRWMESFGSRVLTTASQSFGKLCCMTTGFRRTMKAIKRMVALRWLAEVV